jgi:hypothetical protein
MRTTNPTTGGTMQENEKSGMTAKNVALTAFAAYCGVKVARAATSSLVSISHFRAARKAEKLNEA